MLNSQLFGHLNAKFFVKRKSSVILPLSVLFLTFIACTRIDTTELGDDLIPAVDNVNTFDTTLDVITDNFLFNDTTRSFTGDDMAVGFISDDPEFGQTIGDMYFNLGSSVYPFWPYNGKDSVKAIDSVVLSLSFRGSHGDTTVPQTFRVFEIGNAAGFKDSAYRLTSPLFRPLGPEVGNKTFTIQTLNDSISLARDPDSPRVANVLRIRLDSTFGRRIVNLDSTGHKSDSMFRAVFRGLAVLPDTNNAGNGLAFFNLSEVAKTKLIIYYKVQKNGKLDTTFSVYTHIANGQANLIRRKPQATNFATYLNNGNPADDKVYIQSTPGSYATVTIPGLSTLSNRVIHRAELIVSRLETPSDAKFGPPNIVFLDEETTDKDSAYTVQNDFLLNPAGNRFAANFDVFGGQLRSDKTYRFNISRRVQGIVTRKDRVLRFRLSAPYEPENWFFPPGRQSDYPASALQMLPFTTLLQPANGRVVLWGGNAPDPTKKMRLYIVYSKI